MPEIGCNYACLIAQMVVIGTLIVCSLIKVRNVNCWWGQFAFALAGVLFVNEFATPFVAGIPGGDLIRCLFVFLYAVALFVLGKKFTKAVALILLCLVLIFVLIIWAEQEKTKQSIGLKRARQQQADPHTSNFVITNPPNER